MRAPVAAILLAALVAGCGGGTAAPVQRTAAPSCPQSWRAGWQRLANRIQTPVYCPSWMPRPLDARIGGAYGNGEYVDPDRSYLVSFVWIDHGSGGIEGEVHVNFRAYPGHTAIPACDDTLTVKGKTVHKQIPCFSDPQGTHRVGGIVAKLYTANQGVDQWHLLYAWRRQGTLYTLSQHVAPPYSYAEVLHNLDRMTRGLVLIEPST